MSLPCNKGVGLIVKALENRGDRKLWEMYFSERSLLPFIDEESRKSFPASFDEFKQNAINKTRQSKTSAEEILKKALIIKQKVGEMNA